MVKKVLSLFLLALIVLIFASCTQNTSENNDGDVVCSTNVEEVDNVVALDYFNAVGLTATIVEDEKFVYYAKKDGIYTQNKSDGYVKMICEHTNTDQLLLHTDELYFVSEDKKSIYRISTQGGDAIEVLDISLFASTISDYRVSAYQIYNNILYIKTGTLLMAYDMDSRELSDLGIDCGEFQVADDKIYFIDHSARTYSVYAMEANTNLKSLVKGQGVQEPVDTIIKEFVLEDGDVYTLERMPSGLFLHQDDQNTILADGTLSCLRNYNDCIYFVSFDHAISYLICYDGENCRTVAELTEFYENSEFAVVNGVVYFNSGYEITEGKMYKLFDYSKCKPVSVKIE